MSSDIHYINKKDCTKFFSYALLLFIGLLLFSGFFGLLSSIVDNQFIRLWKELYISMFFIALSCYYYPSYNKKEIIVLFSLSIFLLIELLNSRDVHYLAILYQIKLDVIIILFGVSVYLYFKILSREQIEKVLSNFLYLVIVLSVVNGLSIILQHYFFESFLRLLDLEYGNWGTSRGVKIITAGGEFRAIGMQMGYVAAGSLMLLSLILVIESRKILNITKGLFFVICIIFILGIFFTTYKTAIIGLLLYTILKVIELFKNNKIKNILLILIISLGYTTFFISTHFMVIYNLVANFNKYYAYNSIYLRVIQHKEIIGEFSGVKEWVLGLGMGANGTFGLDKKSLNMTPVPTDSTYIYLLSNYGLIVTILFSFFLIYLIIKFVTRSEHDVLGMRYILIYLLVVEFFYNNTLVNFPINFIVILGVFLIFNRSSNSQEFQITRGV